MVMEYFKELLNILNAMSPYLLLGFFVAGLLHVYVSKSTFSKYLSKKGFKSVFLSAIFGIPLPLCSCGVIPTAMSLKKEGASDGATVSFLIATPQTGVDSILATYGVLGLPFAIIRPFVALVVALLGGILVDKFSLPVKYKEDENQCCQKNTNKKLTFLDVFNYGFINMLQDLGKWLVIGLLIAAAITVFVPNTVFELFSDYYILNILVILLLSIPMYICSTGSIPIALSLLLKGISPGAALVFLMAGPATNVATLAVLRKVLGLKITILYLLSIILGAIGFAVLIDFLLPIEWFTSILSKESAHIHSHGAAWWQTASSMIFVVLLVNAFIAKYRRRNVKNEPNEEYGVRKIKVQGMRCNHCKASIEKAINELPSVTSATVDLQSGVLEIYGDVQMKEIAKIIKQLGFEVVNY